MFVMLSKDGNCYKTANDIRKKEYLESLGYKVISDDGKVQAPQDVELDKEPEKKSEKKTASKKVDKEPKKASEKKSAKTDEKAVELD